MRFFRRKKKVRLRVVSGIERLYILSRMDSYRRMMRHHAAMRQIRKARRDIPEEV